MGRTITQCAEKIMKIIKFRVLYKLHLLLSFSCTYSHRLCIYKVEQGTKIIVEIQCISTIYHIHIWLRINHNYAPSFTVSWKVFQLPLELPNSCTLAPLSCATCFWGDPLVGHATIGFMTWAMQSSSLPTVWPTHCHVRLLINPSMGCSKFGQMRVP